MRQPDTAKLYGRRRVSGSDPDEELLLGGREARWEPRCRTPGTPNAVAVRRHAHGRPICAFVQTSVESVAGQGWRSAADQKTRMRSASVTNLTPFHVANETSGLAVAQPAMESAVLHGTPNPSARSPVVRVR